MIANWIVCIRLVPSLVQLNNERKYVYMCTMWIKIHFYFIILEFNVLTSWMQTIYCLCCWYVSRCPIYVNNERSSFSSNGKIMHIWTIWMPYCDVHGAFVGSEQIKITSWIKKMNELNEAGNNNDIQHSSAFLRINKIKFMTHSRASPVHTICIQWNSI